MQHCFVKTLNLAAQPRRSEKIGHDLIHYNCSGSTRKCKPLDKQKQGKMKMRQFGKVDIPQEAFIAVPKLGA